MTGDVTGFELRLMDVPWWAMSVELGVACRRVPDAEQVARLVGPLMCMVLRRPVIHALIDEDDDGDWTVRWDATYTVVTHCPPGQYEWEYGDRWYLDVGLGERGIDLSLLLMSITAAAIAILGDGFLVDEWGLVTGDRLSGREVSAGELLTRASGQGWDRSPQDVLAALGAHSWGE